LRARKPSQPPDRQRAVVLFNSYIFLYAFLPISLGGFFAACRFGQTPASIWLVFASLVFYGWWNPAFLVVLTGSITFNYTMSRLILGTRVRPAVSNLLLLGAIAGDIATLAYYKYLGAILGFLHQNGVLADPARHIALPLGISFFTFTQIGYLVDVAQGVAQESGLLRYLLFVTFFPHLIAGPILHNREMMPQFAAASTWRASGLNVAVGSAIFIIGLIKKCVFADPNSSVVAAGFADPAALGLLSAWHTALSYSLQLYFDFSGYSDMAIGLARMFNLKFPQNFNSPYKAVCIIDYWQRWHMTLTRYLNLYLFNPVALAITRWRAARGLRATRKPTITSFAETLIVPTLFTMTLAGIWHGAGLQFLVFGVLHGIYLIINHAWRAFGPHRRLGGDPTLLHACKVALTYLCVLVGAVFFRAANCTDALDLLAGMVGLHGTSGLAAGVHAMSTGDLVRTLAWLGMLYGIVWFMPSTQQIMRGFEPTLGRIQPGPWPRLAWQPNGRWAVLSGLAATIGMLAMGGSTEFLYFQF
jgi:D-alanyl-lipoteichoic acid acyltransferase DltB (MBOAT superfamily)